MRYLIFYSFCPIAEFLVNAVNFPGTTRPFSSWFKGTRNKRPTKLSTLLRISPGAYWRKYGLVKMTFDHVRGVNRPFALRGNVTSFL